MDFSNAYLLSVLLNLFQLNFNCLMDSSTLSFDWRSPMMFMCRIFFLEYYKRESYRQEKNVVRKMKFTLTKGVAQEKKSRVRRLALA